MPTPVIELKALAAGLPQGPAASAMGLDEEEELIMDPGVNAEQGVWEPNRVFASPSAFTKSGRGSQSPSDRVLASNDMPYTFRGGFGATRRPLPEVLLDGPAWISWAINQKNMYDNLTTLATLMKRELVLGIDQNRIYLRSSLSLKVFNNKTILCLTGSGFNGPVQFIITRNDVPLVDATDATNVKIFGYLNVSYLEPAEAGTPALKLANTTGCWIEGLGLHYAATGLSASGTNRDNVIGMLNVEDASEDGISLNSGRDLTIHRAKIVRCRRALNATNSWLGDLKIGELVGRECQQEGMLYAAAGQIDRISHVDLDNNGLASVGTYDGLKVDALGRNLQIMGGSIGIGSGWRYANGSIQAEALVSVGEHLYVGSKTYTFVASSPGANDIVIGASTTTLIANIRNKLQADGVITADVKVEYAGGVVTITHKTIGASGNSYVLATDAAWIRAKSTFHLNTRPVAGGTLTLNGTVITFKTSGAIAANNEVNLGTSTASFSGLLLAFLNSAADANIAAATYTYASSTFTVIHDTPGVAGNAYTLVTDQPLAFTLASPTLVGGEDRPALTLTGAGTLTGGTGASTQRYGVNVTSGADQISVRASLPGNVTAAYNVGGTPNDVEVLGVMPAGTLQKLSASFIASLPP